MSGWGVVVRGRAWSSGGRHRESAQTGQRRLGDGAEPIDSAPADYQGKYLHVINVGDASLIDDEVLGWLTEAYHVAGGTEHLLELDEATGDGMVPDDVEDLF